VQNTFHTCIWWSISITTQWTQLQCMYKKIFHHLMWLFNYKICDLLSNRLKFKFTIDIILYNGNVRSATNITLMKSTQCIYKEHSNYLYKFPTIQVRVCFQNICRLQLSLERFSKIKFAKLIKTCRHTICHWHAQNVFQPTWQAI
jgi:hypothetical protein